MAARDSGRSRTKRRLLGPLALLLLFGGAVSADDSLESIKRSGEIRVLTFPGTATYQETPDGPEGFEYDLAKAFADRLGVRLRVVLAENLENALERLERGEGDFAAAAIPAIDELRKRVRLTAPYHHVRYHVVHRLGSARPAAPGALIDRELEVQAGSAYAALLRQLRRRHPALSWLESSDRNAEEHLQLVGEGLLDLTVADARAYAVNRQHFPELQAAFALGPPLPLVWAFRRSGHDSLYRTASAFLREQRRSGEIARLLDRYFGPASRSNFVDLTVYRTRVHERLPRYRKLLEAAGRRYELDWRLLAALAYQESHWDPKSVSFTGVRGFMMLTRTTAAALGIDNRADLHASIDGGARYLRELLDRLPARIEEPDRTWFALAAYNVGRGHLEDARILTERRGGDPDKWADVRQRLPLLADPQWYPRTRYGFARGHEPVRFVDRVRVYYEVLTKMDEEQDAGRTTPALQLKAPAL